MHALGAMLRCKRNTCVVAVANERQQWRVRRSRRRPRNASSAGAFDDACRCTKRENRRSLDNCGKSHRASATSPGRATKRGRLFIRKADRSLTALSRRVWAIAKSRRRASVGRASGRRRVTAGCAGARPRETKKILRRIIGRAWSLGEARGAKEQQRRARHRLETACRQSLGCRTESVSGERRE